MSQVSPTSDIAISLKGVTKIFGSAPDSHANSELTGSSSTLGQINTATQSDRAQGTGTALSSSETTALNGGGRYDTQGAFSGASGNHRTSATLAAQSIVAGSVSVSSLDRTVVDNNAGAIAAGAVTSSTPQEPVLPYVWWTCGRAHGTALLGWNHDELLGELLEDLRAQTD